MEWKSSFLEAPVAQLRLFGSATVYDFQFAAGDAHNSPHVLVTRNLSCHLRWRTRNFLPIWLVSLEKFSASPPGASLTEAGWEW